MVAFNFMGKFEPKIKTRVKISTIRSTQRCDVVNLKDRVADIIGAETKQTPTRPTTTKATPKGTPTQ